MTKEQVIERLKEKTAEDPKFSAVAHVLAFRKRDRYCMSARGLWLKMRREGFQYKESEFIPVLEFLAGLGLGKAEVDRRGNVVSLRNLRMPIPLLGAAACGEKIDLDKIDKPLPVEAFGQKPLKVVPMPKKREIKPAPAKKPEPVRAMPAKPLQLTVTLYLNQKPIPIAVPATLTGEEQLRLIQALGEAEARLERG